jgi:hypothetical protein
MVALCEELNAKLDVVEDVEYIDEDDWERPDR